MSETCQYQLLACLFKLKITSKDGHFWCYISQMLQFLQQIIKHNQSDDYIHKRLFKGQSISYEFQKSCFNSGLGAPPSTICRMLMFAEYLDLILQMLKLTLEIQASCKCYILIYIYIQKYQNGSLFVLLQHHILPMYCPSLIYVQNSQSLIIQLSLSKFSSLQLNW